jgi:hypothetical protein
MTSLWKHVTQHLSLSMIALLLIMLLAACGSLGGKASSSTPAATPSLTPVLTTYKGSGYTISYPKDWKKSVNSVQSDFQDSLGANGLVVMEFPNPNRTIQPSAILDATLSGTVKGIPLTNTSSANLPASVSLAGETWMQKGTIGTLSKGLVKVSFEVVVLTKNHPANTSKTRLFGFVYLGLLDGSSSKLVDAQIFQAMLASFKFTS